MKYRELSVKVQTATRISYRRSIQIIFRVFIYNNIESSYAVYHKTVSVSFAIKYKSLIARRPTIHIKDMYP